MKIAIINGPNLNLLGLREPSIYGADTLSDIESWVREGTLGRVELQFFQSNIEGELVGRLQSVGYEEDFDAVIINPGAYTHYSIAIRDAISAIGIPVVEVHLSNIHAREEFRHRTVVGGVCKARIEGMGWRGYLYAIEYLIEYFAETKSNG